MIFTWEYINSFAIVMCQSVILIRSSDQMFNVMPLIKFQSPYLLFFRHQSFLRYSICLILLILFVLSIFLNWTALHFPTLSYANFYQVKIVFCYIWNHDFWLMLFFMDVVVVVEFNAETEVSFHPVGRYVWPLLYVSLYWFYMNLFNTMVLRNFNSIFLYVILIAMVCKSIYWLLLIFLVYNDRNYVLRCFLWKMSSDSLHLIFFFRLCNAHIKRV